VLSRAGAERQFLRLLPSGLPAPDPTSCRLGPSPAGRDAADCRAANGRNDIGHRRLLVEEVGHDDETTVDIAECLDQRRIAYAESTVGGA
jgi:hypothetical protein